MLRLGLLVVALVAVSGCDTDAPSTDASPLASTAWALVSLPAMDAEPTTTITFDASGQLNGRAACNSYSGAYSALSGGVVGPRFEATVDTMTEVGCMGDGNAYETAYWNLLRRASRWSVDDGRLSLTVAVGEEMVFVRVLED